MKKLFFIALLLPFAALAQSPGGVSGGLRWWLKSDVGVFNSVPAPATNGGSIAQWTDQSGIANHATQGLNSVRPIYQTNIINGYPVLRFDGTKYLDATTAPNITGTTGFDFFVVFKQSSFTAGATNDGAGDFIIDRTTATTPLTSLKIAATDKYFFQERDDSGNLGGPVSTLSVNTSNFVIAHYYRNGLYGLSMNGAVSATSADNGNLTAPILRIGRHATAGSGGIVGDMTEIAVYNTPLIATDSKKIESYLAIKYGITLDQATPTNYVSSAGTIVYPATTTHDLFDIDIAGIGVDNGSGLSQFSSQSQNANSLIRIYNPTPALTNSQFMIWGNNSATIGNSSDTPPGYANRLSRVWRVAKTGFAGTVSIDFDVTGLGLNLTDPTKFALLIDNDGVFSDATPWTNGRSIVGNVITFTLANISNLNYFTLATDLIPGPGGVGGSVVWLRADKNAYIDAGVTLATTNGQTIRQWNNQGQTGYNVSQATAANRPSYQTNSINANPVLRFVSSANDSFLDAGSMGIGSTSSLDYSVVVKPSSTANAGTTADFAGGYILDRSSATSSANPIFSLKLVTPSLFAFQKRNDANAGLGGMPTVSSASTINPQIVEYFRTYSSQYGILYNGALESTLADADGPLTLPNLRIGSAFAGSNVGLNGDIAEVVFYNRTLTTVERQRINTYLAIKYGITMDQSTLTNYLSSDGATVLYPTTSSHSGYKSDIAGIGQDPISSLVQTNSRSTSGANPIVTMSSPSNLNDYEFLIWGDNAATLAVANTSDVQAPVLRRMSRVWRVAEKNGDVGTVSLVFDLTNVPGPKTQAHLRLLVDANGAFNAGATAYTGTLAGQIFTVTTAINFADGEYFTIGSTNNATPLPIQLVDFTAEAVGNFVQTTWKTETETNNDFFTLERSKEGKEFEVVGTIKGAGTSQRPLNYSFADKTPYFGLSYYRLKQTDFDGNSSFSKVRSVTIDSPSTSTVIVHPNPTKGSDFKMQFNAIAQGEAMVEIFNLTGQRLHSEVMTNLQIGINNWNITPNSTLTPGMYIARVSVGGRMFVTKMIVQ